MRKQKKTSKGKRIRKISVEDALAIAVQLHQRGLVEEAKRVYDDVLSVVSDQVDATHYLGVIAHQLGDSEKGLALIKKSLAIKPDQPDALNNVGNIYREIGQLDEARKFYAKVLELAPNHADSWVNIGVILRQLSNPEEALKKLQKAIELNPKHGEAYHNLGNTLVDLERFDEAIDAYEMATKVCPERDIPHKSIARVQYNLGRKDDAIRTIQRWRFVNPDDALAKHLLSAYTGENVPKQASEDFVRESFDGFSKSFDEVLARLNYKAPKYVGDLVEKRLPELNGGHRILDIGCGTGLCGPLIKPFASTLVGIDLSTGMLEKAKERGVYDRLEVAELTRYMNDNTASCDVITCVDTLCYIGDLSQVLPAAYSCIDKQGWFFFTVEQHLDSDHEQDYWLHLHGRYSHKRPYIVALLEAAGFEVDTTEDVVLRREGPNEVSGLLVGARKLNTVQAVCQVTR